MIQYRQPQPGPPTVYRQEKGFSIEDNFLDYTRPALFVVRWPDRGMVNFCLTLEDANASLDRILNHGLH